MSSGNRKARDQPGSDTAQRDFIGNDEMLEIDKRRDDQQRDENPIGDRDLPRKRVPNGEKEQRSEQFDQKVAKRQFALPQFAQRPRKAIQLTSGMFWYHGISFLHDGQKDRRGLLTERSRGKR